MQILLINNDGGGFADHIDINEGTSVSALFAEQIKGRKASDYLIRVNRLIELQGEFSGLDVTLCPRCSKTIPENDIDRESMTHECRLCSRVTSEASPEYVKQLELEAVDHDDVEC
jgi:NAD-dependent SIR2 family protein deacetylase